MRNWDRGGRWALVVGLLGAVAAAQEPAAVPVEYRPTLAVLEVVPVDLASIERAQQLEVALLSMLATSEQFERVSSPQQVREAVVAFELGSDERASLEAARAQLEVHRVARLTVQEQGLGSRVTLVGLDPALPELLLVEIENEQRAELFEGLVLRTPAERDLEFLRVVIPQLREAFRGLAAPNAKLIVENADPGLTVWIDGEPVGTGRYEAIRPPGSVLVSIAGSFYEPFDRMVTLEPAQATTVELRLVARPVAPLIVTKPPYRGVMSRPGAYLAMSGLTLLSVGLGLGIATLSVGDRVSQGGAMPRVTRLEAVSAPGNAIAANVLVGLGLALSAGGVTWIALTPSPQTSVGVDEPTVPSDAQGWTLSMGGNF